MATARPRPAIPGRLTAAVTAGVLGLTFGVALAPTTAQAAPLQSAASATTATGLIAGDDFARSSSSGWGTAATGGAWTTSGGDATDFTVANGVATMNVRSAGWQLTSTLRDAQSTSTEARTRVALSARPTGGAVDVDVVSRAVNDSSGYLLRLKVLADGRVRPSLVKMNGGSATTLAAVNLSGLSYTDGSSLQVRVQTEGTGTTTLRAKVWQSGAAEPDGWQVTATDRTAALQSAGAVALRTYTASGVTNAPLAASFAGFVAGPLDATPEPGTTTPSTPAPEIGEYVPDASTTGVPAGTNLTVHQGDLVLDKAGTVVDGLDVRGVVKVTAKDVVIRNSVIRGKSTNKQTALVTSASDNASVTIEDSELYNSQPGPWIDGVRGWNFTLRRVNLHDVIDMVHIYGGNVTIEGSYLHDNLHYEVDPAQNNKPSHDDSIQIQKGSNIRVYGNNISGATNTGIQFTQDQGVVSDVTIQANLLDGGGCTVNLAEKGKGPFQRISILDNTFGRTTKVSNCAIISPTTTKLTTANNFYTDGAAVTVRKGS